ncbi:hypothetical protein BGW38_009171, partial [Lunasporangiospora selenospora]
PATPTMPQVSFVNLYSEDPWRKRQRVRIQQACSECRRQKIKCDGQKPCKSCKKSDRNCVYNASGAHASGSSSPSTHSPSSLAQPGPHPAGPSNAAASATVPANANKGSAPNSGDQLTADPVSALVMTLTDQSQQQQQQQQQHTPPPTHPHSPHPYSKPHHQHAVGHGALNRHHHHIQHNHHGKESSNPLVKQEPSDLAKPSPLRKDSRHKLESDIMAKVQVKDIGKYGVPLDEWQKLDDSSSSSARKP